jgi:hypothetical protein
VRGISGINAGRRKTLWRLVRKTINQNKLADRDENQQRPNHIFAEAQAALRRGRKPELDFGRAKGDNITIAKDGILNLLAIDGGNGIRGGGQVKTVSLLKFESEMLLPNPVVFQRQMILGRASDTKWKMAGHRSAPRLFPGKNVEMNHQK